MGEAEQETAVGEPVVAPQEAEAAVETTLARETPSPVGPAMIQSHLRSSCYGAPPHPPQMESLHAAAAATPARPLRPPQDLEVFPPPVTQNRINVGMIVVRSVGVS
jgi:hypothetical protein